MQQQGKTCSMNSPLQDFVQEISVSEASLSGRVAPWHGLRKDFGCTFISASSGSLEQALSRDTEVQLVSGLQLRPNSFTSPIRTSKGENLRSLLQTCCSFREAWRRITLFWISHSLGGTTWVWEVGKRVIGCETSGVNMPHDVQHPLLKSAGSHALTWGDIRQESLRMGSLCNICVCYRG